MNEPLRFGLATRPSGIVRPMETGGLGEHLRRLDVRPYDKDKGLSGPAQGGPNGHGNMRRTASAVHPNGLGRRCRTPAAKAIAATGKRRRSLVRMAYAVGTGARRFSRAAQSRLINRPTGRISMYVKPIFTMGFL